MAEQLLIDIENKKDVNRWSVYICRVKLTELAKDKPEWVQDKVFRLIESAEESL